MGSRHGWNYSSTKCQSDRRVVPSSFVTAIHFIGLFKINGAEWASSHLVANCADVQERRSTHNIVCQHSCKHLIFFTVS